MVRRHLLILTVVCLVFPAAHAEAQFGAPLKLSNPVPGLDQERTQLWKAGIRVNAAAGPCGGVRGAFYVPVDWPEQDVKVVEESISENVSQTRYTNLDDHLRQLAFGVQHLGFREQAEVVLTFEITRRTKPIPLDTSAYSVPKKMPRDARKCLTTSPLIDCRNSRIRMKAKEITADIEPGWEKVEAIHDWIRDNVEQTNDALRGAVETLAQKKGNHEDLTNLFIALCRASKVPARMVWVPNYCYAEFYLEGEEASDIDAAPSDETGDQEPDQKTARSSIRRIAKDRDADIKGEWFPCEIKEKTEFGTVSQPFIILQKGDNFRVPEKRERYRFVPEQVKVKTGSKPTVSFVRSELGIK